MQFSAIARILGLLLLLFSVSLLPPIVVSWYYQDGETRYFLYTLGGLLGVGLLSRLLAPGSADLRTRDGFLIVTLFWAGLGFVSGLPFHFSPTPHLSYTDATFEALSGFTTTGATVLQQIEILPPSLLYYRQQLQWLGGMGMIVLAVAVLPMLGVGGMQLYRAEIPGPVKDEKLTPRLARTAQLFWLFYVGLTVLGALAFWAAGMTPFDAIGHSFSAISTGGFSTHDASLGFFNSPLIEAIAIVLMLAGAMNFSVHFLSWRQRSLKVYWRNEEVRAFLLIVLSLTVLIAVCLYFSGRYGMLASLRHSAFTLVSIITSTGFITEAFAEWPVFLSLLLIYISFIGGCAGSTAGGVKVVRILLLLKQSYREIMRLIHPRGMIPIKISGHAIGDDVKSAVWGFFALYVFTAAGLTILMVSTGLDVLSAFSAVAACLNVLGPGLGDVAVNFATVTTPGKWILIIAMLLGRLEIFTVLVLLTPAFWRR